MPGKTNGPRSPKIIYLKPISDVQHDRQRRVLDAIALKRRQPALSLTAAARQCGTTVKTVRRYAGGTLQTRSGRLDVSAIDRITRDLRFLSPKGQMTVRVNNSRDATRIARYNNAIRRYASTGDTSQLKAFEGKSLRAGGKLHPFVTDPAVLNKLVRAGEVHFLDIYAGPNEDDRR